MKTGLIAACAVLSLTTFAAHGIDGVPATPAISFHAPTGAYKGDTVIYETRSFMPEAFGGGTCAARNSQGTWSYFGFSIARVNFSGQRDSRGEYRALVCSVKVNMKGTWRVGTNVKAFQQDGGVWTHTFVQDLTVI